MGLFSFLKKAGSKLFSKNEKDRVGTTTDGIKEEVAQAQKVSLLKSVAASLNYEIENFELEVDDDKVILYGKMFSQTEREKLILAVGNVAGIATVDATNLTVEARVEEPEAQFYTVQKGDYLSKIAKNFYGDPMKYPIIFEANKPMLKDPDLIYPGQVLRIPPLQA